jgi:Family of unknown function (DUF5681)
MSDKPENEPDVGYGKPPVNTQFKKGQSGNPGGRPRTSRATMALDRALSQPVMLQNGSRGTRLDEIMENLVRWSTGDGYYLTLLLKELRYREKLAGASARLADDASTEEDSETG